MSRLRNNISDSDLTYPLCLLQPSLQYLLAVILLASLLSCRLEGDARPTGPLLHSTVSKDTDASRQLVQAENKAGLTPNQGETDRQGNSSVRATKETGLAPNQRENENEEASRENVQARREIGTTRHKERIAEGGFIRTRFNRNAKLNNHCIRRFDYRIIYNQFFAIPICKNHKRCIPVIKIVNFGQGKNLPITYNCTRE